MRYEVKREPEADKWRIRVWDNQKEHCCCFFDYGEEDKAEAVAKVLNDMEPLEPGWYWVKCNSVSLWTVQRLNSAGKFLWHDEERKPSSYYALGPRIPEPEEE